MTEDKATTLDAAAGRQLVRIARHSLLAFVQKCEPYEPLLARLPEALRRPGSCFVTVMNQGRLRGCIGSTRAEYPLAYDAARNAAAAAQDPRFSPVVAAELDDIRLEVTVLRPPQPLTYRDNADLLLRLRPGVDGVIISWRERRALLLPQVWAHIPDPDDFLQALCHKAKIPWQELQALPPTVMVLIFQANSFAEDGYFLTH